MTFSEAMERVAQIFEVIGALVLLTGLVVAVGLGVRTYRRTADGSLAYRAVRESFGGVILLGLEVLVAADLVRTVAVETTLESVAVLGGIVLIRTVLSFSLDTEIEGVAPWRRAAMSGAGRVLRAARRSGAVDAAGPADPVA
jgi:uncharacterized membrane protein